MTIPNPFRPYSWPTLTRSLATIATRPTPPVEAAS